MCLIAFINLWTKANQHFFQLLANISCLQAAVLHLTDFIGESSQLYINGKTIYHKIRNFSDKFYFS